MDVERWKLLDSLLQSVLERPLENRDVFLHEICAGDEALERELRTLLHLESQAGCFLDRPAIEVARPTSLAARIGARRTAWTR